MAKKKDPKRLERERKILLTRVKLGAASPEDRARLAEIERLLSAAPSSSATPPPMPAARPSPRVPAGPLSEQDLFADAFDDSSSGGRSGARPVELGCGKTLQKNDLSGPRQAVVFLTSGLTRKGLLVAPDTDAEVVRLEAGEASEAPQEIRAEQIRFVRLMTPAGVGAPEKTGERVQVQLRDGQVLTGTSPDHAAKTRAFTLFPDGERFTERLLVYWHAVRDFRAEDGAAEPADEQ
ncbi:MAG: hypothetical protein GYA21_14065 [Myxococcales bacterium]|nr:hypothetical protein [Myxococcales bacterium]